MTQSTRGPTSSRPSRLCPLHYRYAPEHFAREADAPLRDLEVLYVVGGLYGNESALQQVLEHFAAERGPKCLVFNGDFHWFDADPAVFSRLQQAVLAHTALRGNVETEIAAAPAGSLEASDAPMADDDDAGCGCAYPDWVGDGVVERSNRILRRLRGVATTAQRAQLAALPMTARADVAGLRVAIVHGDLQSLAGWDFAQEHLQDAAHRDAVRALLARAGIDAVACTHTCLPVFQSIALPGREAWIFNNGATGMPNVSGDAAGLFTRIAVRPFDGPQRRFGVRIGDAHVEGIAVDIGPSFIDAFLSMWPAGSDAHESYFTRMARGPDYSWSQVVRRER